MASGFVLPRGPGAVDLPPCAIVSIVAASAVIGWAFVFLLCLVLALLLRWVTGVRESPALVLFAAGEVVGYFRRRLFRGAPELVHSEPTVAAPPGSVPPI
jgi:hypothetical protein